MNQEFRMKVSHNETAKKIESDIIRRLEETSAKSFTVQMILTTILSYLSALAIMSLIDINLYQATGGEVNIIGFIEYFLSSSLISFVPIALLSTVFVLIMTNPIRKIMIKTEKGEELSEADSVSAKKRSANITKIIFIVNILFPLITNIISGAFNENITLGSPH